MKKLLSLTLLTLATTSFAGSPAQDKVVAKYRNAFAASKGVIWDMTKDDGVYFACNLYSARQGSADRSFFNFRVSNDGDINIINTNLVTSRFSGVPLLPEKHEVVGLTGAGDGANPLELIAIRVGAPISMEKPMIDTWENNGVPTRIMSRPLYIEVSHVQEGRSVGFLTKPIATEAQLDKRFRVKEYGVCFLSKENSRLNNSGRGFAGNTRSAWDGASIWGGAPYIGGGY
jgi:hypothetical protein